MGKTNIDKAREIWWEIQTSNRNGICIIADGLAAALAEAEDAGRFVDSRNWTLSPSKRGLING